MNIAALVSLTGLACYGWLTVLVLRYGWRRMEEVHRLFLAYLVLMAIWQGAALGVSLAHTEDATRTWYTVMSIALFSQFLIYGALVRAFLNVRTAKWIIRLGWAVWATSSFIALANPQALIAKLTWSAQSEIYIPEFGTLALFPGVFYLAVLIDCGVLLYRKYGTTDTAMERSRLRYLLAGLAAVLIGIVSQLFPLLRVYPIDVVANIINAGLIAYAIFRYQLPSVTLVIRKGLLYSIPTLALSAGYFLTISLAINLLHVSLGGQVFLLSMLLAVGAALVAEPARCRLQRVVDRLFFRESYNSDAMLQRLSRTTATILDLDRLTEMILDDIQKTMHLSSGSFLIKQSPTGDYVVRAQTGFHNGLEDHWRLSSDHPIVAWLIREQASLAAYEVDLNPEFKALWTREREEPGALDVALFVPLLIRNDLIGILCLGPKLSELPYAANEQLVLSTLANQTAVAIENASLFSESVTEKKRTSTIIEQTSAGIILLDSNLRVASLNPAAEAIIGLRAAQIQGKPLSSVLGPGITGRDSSLWQAVATGQRVAPREETLVCNDRLCDVLLGIAPLKDGYLLSLADITQVKEADRFKSDIVSNVSHEFRTPLAIIKAYAELLIDEVDADDVALRREFLSVIDSETNRLADLVSNLLDLARLEARRGVEEMAPVAMTKIVDEVIAEARFEAATREVTIDTEMAAALPTVMGNKSLLAIMFRNLLGNAIKFSRPGGRVEVSVEHAGSSLLIKVTDHGIGISEADLPHLFERFYRSTTAQEAGIRGTGIGLVLVKQAVEAHHGSINVDSHLGSGTCFTVTLPTNGATPEAAAHVVELLPEPEFAL